MKSMISYFLRGIFVMLIFTFVMGITDDAFKVKYYEGVWYKDILNSLKYYIFWVLPYWWLFILIGAIILTMLFSGIGILIRKFT
ncbi:hypothetical protein [Myroides odoratus]|uniref:hypothetical protein n=1 Tax=Myroides odoratus TaxID=256 RepID=UPI00333E301C